MKKNDLSLFKSQAKDLRKSLKKGKLQVEDLSKYIDTLFIPMYQLLLNESTDKDDFTDYLYLCMDYYTYTDALLISDYDYDMLMVRYEYLGGIRMTTADALELSTRWPLVKHEEPGIVGSIEKIYTEEELEKYYNKYRWCTSYIIGPKFDGISSSVKVVDGKIVKGCTRYDGYEGQDITQVVIRAKNAYNFADSMWLTKGEPPRDGYYKVELCVGSSDFEELIKEKEYANRRSATSGIINSPKNIDLAKYVTIIPLAYYSFDKEFYYHPLYMKYIDTIGGWKALYREIKEMIAKCNIADFEYRTDGAVIMPVDKSIPLDESDLMSNGIAFKINTKIGRTKIKNLYVSVGRMGKAVPMANVVPVEVNETRVHDVSLGSFDKAIAMNLHEGEIVEVYSAGDVIPQVRLPEEKEYPKGAPYLRIDMRCPYCGEKLERRNSKEYYCDNDDCVRINAGRITNFLSKLGAENISDATIEDFYMHKLIKDIPDLFELKNEDIYELEGYGELSAFNIITELVRIRTQSTTIDKFFGALGIPDIGEKTARKIFSVIDIDDLKHKKDKLFMKLVVADGIGEKTATTFIKFVKKNEYLIDTLMNQMNIVSMQSWKGNVVFTGMRSAELAERFNKLGYEVSENINSKTIAVITNNANMSSGKCKTALQRGIDVIFITEVEDFIKKLKKM